MTPDVSTPLYKAPECFFGQKFYNEKVDVWACGCILYEILTSHHMLPTNYNEEGVVIGQFSLFGLPNEETWPGVGRLPKFAHYSDIYKS